MICTGSGEFEISYHVLQNLRELHVHTRLFFRDPCAQVRDDLIRGAATLAFDFTAISPELASVTAARPSCSPCDGKPLHLGDLVNHLLEMAGADLIDLNMGCPVPKVCKTGAGAALLDDPARAVALARAAARGSGLPVTVKLRSGLRPGDHGGLDVARRLVFDGGVAGICIHPRHASQRHAGKPDYAIARQLVEELPVPVLISGGLQTAEKARVAFEQTGAEGVLLARGSLGNPWLFAELLGERSGEPDRDEILAELDWVIERACEHLGPERAAHYLRKFYPWYVERLGGGRALQAAVQQAPGIDAARALLADHTAPRRAAA